MIADLPAVLAPVFAPGGDERLAIRCGGRSLAYGELRRAVTAMRAELAANGVEPGDRVAFSMPKSLESVVATLAILAAGAAYAPLDPGLSASQVRFVLDDLRPRLFIATPSRLQALRQWEDAHAETCCPLASSQRCAVVDERALRLTMVEAGKDGDALAPSPGLATILYTSGSTGAPKGIMLSHANVESFVAWGARTFAIRSSDRLINHAPLHFDLSIFDLFCGLGRGASVHLVDETTALFPGAVRNLVEAAGITVWYSAPTALARLQERAALKGLDSLRLILFAGEVFPTPILRRLMADAPRPEYANLYGPTETNVCAFYPLPGPPASDVEAIPIGWPCDHTEIRLLDGGGRDVQGGETGEICVAGPSVMQGYWARPDLTESARLGSWRADSYRTGDFATRRGDGALMFAGRRDQQVKVRGRRIELTALEAVLNAHPEIREAAALHLPASRPGGALGVALVAGGERLGQGAIRAYVAERLPESYAPDVVEWLDDLPRLTNGKVDRARLRCLFESMQVN